MATRELSLLRDDALALSEAERVLLLHDLLASLDGPVEAGVDNAWDKEIVRRLDEIASGDAGLRDASEVIADVRRHIS